MTHQHTCPSCGHQWGCDAQPPQPCANAPALASPNRLCDPCWGMAKPARNNPKDRP